MRLPKAQLEALEKVFAAEIEGRVYQSRAKIFTQLAAEGMVEEETLTLPGRFPVRVPGWGLTHRGRILYCAACADLPAD